MIISARRPRGPSLPLDLRPLGAYLRDPRPGEHELPELPVDLAAPPGPAAAALEDDVLTLWLFGKGRVGAIRQVPSVRWTWTRLPS